MQGIYILNDSGRYVRPKSKKEVKELVAAGRLSAVHAESTSLHGGEYEGPLADAPAGTIHFCGPDPYVRRSFYGSITVCPDGKVVVK